MKTKLQRLKKDKPYNVRLNKSLVETVKENDKLSPQKILDKYYSEYLARTAEVIKPVDELEDF